MKERIRHSPEAIERIRQLGEREILKFFDEISLGSVRNIADYLPTVHGFRPRSEAGIRQQKNALSKRIANRTGGTERDQFALYVMWRAWAWEKLGDADAAEHILDDLEKAITPPRNPDERTAETLRAATLSFVEALREMSVENKCSRETIERLLAFSPLAIDDAVQKSVSNCKSAKEIERDAAMSNLPDRLKEDEQVIQEVRSRVESVAFDLNKLRVDFSSLNERQHRNERAIHGLSESIATLQLPHDLNEAEKAQNDTLEAHNKKLQEFQSRLEALATEKGDLVGLLSSTVTPIEDRLQVLQEKIEQITEKIGSASSVDADAFKLLSDELDALNVTVGALSRKDGSEAITVLTQRVAALEERLGAASPVSITSTRRPRAEDALPFSKVKIGASATPNVCTNANEVVNALSAGFQSIGLKKSAAITLAEETCAASLTGQIVFFKGALASEVARICAASVSASATVISIPIGLVGGSSLANAIEEAGAENHSQNVAGIVLEGVNRSAFDAIKETLMAFQSQYTSMASLAAFCFGSFSSGIASLPVEPEHLESGPVFDLDYLEWRVSFDGTKSIAGNVVSIDAARSLGSKLSTGSGDDLDEALRVLRQFIRKRNPLIERNIARAFSALKHLRADTSEVSPMQSIAFGWLVPLWVALGVSKENADSELDGGKCDNHKADPRLAAMLESERFGGVSARGDR